MESSRPIDGVPGEIRQEKRLWLIQRIAWGVTVAVLIAALAGLFGSGPLSSSRATSPDGKVALEYERFWRADAPMPLRVRFQAPDEGGEARVSISRRYLKQGSIERLLPEPERVEVSGESLTYIYPVRGGGGLEVVFLVEFDEPGMHEGRLAVNGSGLDFRQLIYP